ncbi:MAG: hypothetical protein J6V72_08920 [Kiritimatiellae bacterium]|nr:hypothetical protein [Kiritimatiellia bacterium]
MNTIGTYSLAPLGIQATPAKGVAALANESLFNNVFFSQPLTDFAVGYSNQEEALQEMLDYLAPAVRAPRKFQYRVMNNKAAFEAVADGSDERALFGEFKVVTTHDGIVDDHTISKGLTTIIDKDELEDDPNVLEKRTAWLKQLQLRGDLLRTVALLNSLATNTAKTWSGSSGAPDMDLRAAIKASRESMGLQPNRVLYGGGAWDARLQLLDKQNTAGAFAGMMRLENELARFARVRDIRVNDLVYSVCSGKQEIVTDSKVYIFSAYNEISTVDASNVKRFWSPVQGGGEWAVYVDDTAAEIIKLTVHHKNKIVSPNTLGVRTLTIS